MRIDRVYTRKGDSGGTRLVGGQKVSKDDVRIDAYGTVDELNAVVGSARESLLNARTQAQPSAVSKVEQLARTLLRVQHELFNLGSLLATLPEDVGPKQPRIVASDVARLETEMDACQNELSPLRSFVLPGGCRPNTELHLARTICRRAERRCVSLAKVSPVDPLAVMYLNRLSDALFVWSRFASVLLGANEVLWEPNVSG